MSYNGRTKFFTIQDCVMWEGIAGKLQDGCLGVVVEKILFFSFVLSDDGLKTIVVDGFCFDSWWFKQGVVDMLFYIYAIYFNYIKYVC
jgi:hypothetical protein